jgi:hypothetical protein
MTFAHAGHWLLDLLYAAPLLVMVGVLAVGRLRERRRGRTNGGTDGGS